MRARRAYTLAELIVIVLILATVVALAAPRLQFGLVRRRQAEMTAWKIVTVLRRARSLAISHAATNPDGFALNIRQTTESTTYEIVDRSSRSVVDSQAIDANVDLSGGMRFEFGPLGTLSEKNDPTLRVSAADKTFTISVVPATGMVRCIESPGT